MLKSVIVDMGNNSKEWYNAIVGIVDGMYGIEFTKIDDKNQVIEFENTTQDNWRIESIVEMIELSDGGRVTKNQNN